MRPARVGGVLAVGLTGVAGGVASLLLARGPGAPVNEAAVLAVLVAYAVVATVIGLARPGHPVGRLMLGGTCLWGLGEGLLALATRELGRGDLEAAGWLASLGAVRGVGWLLLVLFLPIRFPDGTTPWGGRRPLVLATVAAGLLFAASVLAPTPLDHRLENLSSPTGVPQRLAFLADLVAVLSLVLVMVSLGIAVAGLVHRWRTGDELLRQRLLWFFTAFALPLLLVPLLPFSFVQPWMFALVSVPAPIAIGVALFQDRLYDVQPAVSRTLTYALLSVVVSTLYATTVGGVGVVLDERGATWLPWVGAGVVAVAFAPLRNTFQRWVNRLTYGQWSQPADVLASTGRRLADAADVPGLLGTIPRELASTLGLEYVAIADTRGRPLAAHGVPQERYDEIPLNAYGRTVGALHVTQGRLRDGDRRLLVDLAAQIGGIVHSAGLVEALRESQESLVRAREEERRRLRRDLHDGLGPALAGLTLQVDTIRNVVASGEDPQAELLSLRGGIAATVLDVRRIVEGLRPPALDELGLDGALVQLVDRAARGSPLAVETSVPARLPVIAAAVEVATYRVAQEALTNAVRHSRAQKVRLVLDVDNGGLCLEVSDNGCGTARPRPGGLGLTSMHERAAEIGGRLTVRTERGGTCVSLWLPIAPEVTR